MPIQIHSFPDGMKLSVIKVIRYATDMGLADSIFASESLPYIIAEIPQRPRKFSYANNGEQPATPTWADITRLLDNIGVVYTIGDENIDPKDIEIASWRRRAEKAEALIASFSRITYAINNYRTP